MPGPLGGWAKKEDAMEIDRRTRTVAEGGSGVWSSSYWFTTGRAGWGDVGGRAYAMAVGCGLTAACQNQGGKEGRRREEYALYS